MAGVEDGDADDLEKAQETDSSFVWDDDSKLYFHASSGFYHDPIAGWYYSSRDGLYYTFENGSYVPLTVIKDEGSEAQQCTSAASAEPVENKLGNEDHFTSDGLENQRPPSEWLEDTLIDLYLSGHSNLEVGAENSTTLQSSKEERNQLSHEELDAEFALDKSPDCHRFQQEKEGSSDILPALEATADLSSDKGSSVDEEKWQAQYGQVVKLEDEAMQDFPTIDLWDWELVAETVGKRQQVARLSGRLVRRSSKLHPSVPVGGGLLKTTAIRDVHLDLVRVASGKVYRLRTPNKRYLASLSAYDSSNPTKDWGFPGLFVNLDNIKSVGFDQTCGINRSEAVTKEKSSTARDMTSVFQKQSNLPYRDRAAERRSLHGGFGIGPGQKNMNGEQSSSPTSYREESAAEAIMMTFGEGSYARKILEKMGWKDGEALGSSTKGILEPLEVVANKGFAGLGWNYTR